MEFKDFKEEDRKRLMELLDETIAILKGDPSDKDDRLKEIYEELCNIKKRIVKENEQRL